MHELNEIMRILCKIYLSLFQNDFKLFQNSYKLLFISICNKFVTKKHLQQPETKKTIYNKNV
jgi:hypothetical protein